MKIRNKPRIMTILSFVLVFFSLVGFAFAEWTFSYDKEFELFQKSDAAPVAYITKDSKKNYYTTIEAALDKSVSGDTVYVIPGTNPTITRNCTIKSGVTLTIPYEDETYMVEKGATIGGFADVDENNVSKNRKNKVTISGSKTLTNNGTLIVGGILGVGSDGKQRPTGHVVSSYCEISMENNAKIANNKEIYTYGYIKESSKENGSSIVNGTSANVYSPLVIYDYRGGTYSSGCAGLGSILGGEDVMPFNIFDFPNIQVRDVFDSGSKLNGLAKVYANDSITEASAVILGSSAGLFRLTSGKVTMKYTPVNCLYTTNDTSSSNKTRDKINTTDVYVDGTMSFSSLSLNVGVSIDTSDMYAPINYKMNIIVSSGTTTISNKLKFLAGSSLIVNEGASLIANASTVFYQDYIPQIITGASNANIYPQLGSAKCVVNGSMTINSSFGGVITTEKESSSVTVGSDFSNTVTTTEILNASTGGISTTKETHKEGGKIYVSYNGTSASNKVLLKNKTYAGAFDVDYHFVATVDLSASVFASSTSTSSTGTITLTASVLPDESFFDLTSITWTISSSSGGTSSNRGMNTISNVASLTTVFTITKTPTWPASYSYTIKFSIKTTSGDTISDTSVKITVS